MIKRILAAAALSALSLAAASAGPVADRQAGMKVRAAQMKVLAPMAQGKAPFDAEAANAAFARLAEEARTADVQAYYPDGSHSGDTSAAPAIWEDLEAFVAANESYAASVAAAAAAAPADLGSFRAAFGEVARHCGACHQDYRTK